MSKDIFFVFGTTHANLFVGRSNENKGGYQPLAMCRSCKGPRGERNGKALSGASISECRSQSVNSHKIKTTY